MLPFSDSDLKRNSFPYINISLIVICTSVFFYELLLGEFDTNLFFLKFGLIPSELVEGVNYSWLSNQGLFTNGQLVGENIKVLEAQGYIVNIESPIPAWATMFTSMFIHGGWMHFIGNMLFLWVFGDNIEDKFGHLRYLLFYLAAGIVACLFQVAVDTSSEIPTIGASGAIAGALGAYFLLFPHSRVSTLVIFFLITVVKIPAVYLLGFWILFQFVPALGELGASSQSGGVAYWAHVGGFVFGLAVVIAYKLFKREPIWPRRPGPPQQTQYWRGRPMDY